MNVSSGEPSGKWKQWARWLPLLGLAFIALWTLSQAQNVIGVAIAFLVTLAAITYRYRLTEQHFELLIDQHHVHVVLYMDVGGRIWLKSYSAGEVQRSCLGESYGNSVWLDHEIVLSGQCYPLRIYVKPYPDGFMISNYDRGFAMVVIKNSFCL